MKKPYRCVCCSKGLNASDAVFIDRHGNVSVNGKPHCPECVSGIEDEESYTLEERIDMITDDD